MYIYAPEPADLLSLSLALVHGHNALRILTTMGGKAITDRFSVATVAVAGRSKERAFSQLPATMHTWLDSSVRSELANRQVRVKTA